MAKEEKQGPDMRLSGYLGGVEVNGLGLVTESLWKHFEEAWRSGDTSHEGLRVAIVGVLEVQTVKVPIPGSAEQPTVNIKLLTVEPVLEDAEVKLVTELQTELRGRRRGDAPSLVTPGGDDVFNGTVKDPTGGEATGEEIRPGVHAEFSEH
jgi:hypothetical protein